jgi:hypothetical protein
MKTKRSKHIPERVMRGWQGLRAWVLLHADGVGKRWRVSTPFNGPNAVWLFASWAIGWKKSIPIRLLAPGGIIAAECNIRKRNEWRGIKLPKRKLINTSLLRPSITVPSLSVSSSSSLLIHTGNLRSPVYNVRA